jgi:hypothetical protein
LEGISLDDEIRVLERAIEQLRAAKAARDSAPVPPMQIAYFGTIAFAAAIKATAEYLRDLAPQMTSAQRSRLERIEQRCEQSPSLRTEG